MNRVRTALICVVIAFMASLALARIHPFGDACLYASKSAGVPVLNDAQVPPDVRRIFVEKCADCHSNRTRTPFYGHFAPVSWLMERDIVEARKAMNFSQWDTYSADQQQTLASKIVQKTRSNEMAPLQYRLIHWNARIVDADQRILGHWAHGPEAKRVIATVTGEGEAGRGKVLFEKRCSGCHALTQNKEGPQLQGVYGRTSGTTAGFDYSAALKKTQVVWDEKSLDKWLTDPDAFIPGNNMDFLVSNPQERLDLICYLKLSSGKQEAQCFSF
jgi:cytochrome c